MIYWANFIPDRVDNIVGRGTVFITGKRKFQVDDELSYEGTRYVIIGIETFQNSLTVGLIVKKLE
jgi:hypothetical protein